MLFETEGWDINNKDVAFGGSDQKKKEDKKAKRKTRKEKAKVKKAINESMTTDEPADELEDEQSSSSKQKKVNKSSKKRESENKLLNSEQPNKKVKEGSSRGQPSTDTEDSSSQHLTPLQRKMMAKLSGSRFRWINEQLYTISSEDALKLMQQQPELFEEYHQGFRRQVETWPENPVDVLVDQVKHRASTRVVNAPGGLPSLFQKKVVIADMGSGDAKFAYEVNKFVQEYNSTSKKDKKKGKTKEKQGSKNLDLKVYSFDLQKLNDLVTVADIKHAPLPDGSCSIVIFCLALMGTNFLDFIKEAYRLLCPRGELWIAEIKSRFTDSSSALSEQLQSQTSSSEFVEALKLLGFFHKKTDDNNKMFTRFEFFKPPLEIIEERKNKAANRKKFIENESSLQALESRRQDIPEGQWLLKPCIYKRR